VLALSRYNIISRFETGKGSSYFLVNPLSGHADILNEEEHQKLLNGNFPDQQLLLEKGYLVEPAQEQARFREAYLRFTEDRDKDELQIFFVPTYACNFGCTYCYQSEYQPEPGWPTREKIDAFFSYLDRELAGKKKYVTLFGGEPLLPSKSAEAGVEYFVEEAAKRGLELAVVTNGFYLKERLGLLMKAKIREIQVTLDGPAEIHDRRRALKGGGPTFDRIVEGVDAALELGVPINLRVVVDRENLPHLHRLADIAIARGWTRSAKFKTQIGRNYELYTCQQAPGKLQTRLELYQELYQEILKHPQIMEFHRPAFHVAKFLFDHQELPGPVFDSCPGCKTEWAFDYSGKIYPCTAMVGKQGEDVGTYYPKVELKNDAISSWQDRDVLSISACKSCPVALICGGGCAAIAKSKQGTIGSPDCRPVRELLEIGMSLYFPEGTPETETEKTNDDTRNQCC